MGEGREKKRDEQDQKNVDTNKQTIDDFTRGQNEVSYVIKYRKITYVISCFFLSPQLIDAGKQLANTCDQIDKTTKKIEENVIDGQKDVSQMIIYTIYFRDKTSFFPDARFL